MGRGPIPLAPVQPAPPRQDRTSTPLRVRPLPRHPVLGNRVARPHCPGIRTCPAFPGVRPRPAQSPPLASSVRRAAWVQRAASQGARATADRSGTRLAIRQDRPSQDPDRPCPGHPDLDRPGHPDPDRPGHPDPDCPGHPVPDLRDRESQRRRSGRRARRFPPHPRGRHRPRPRPADRAVRCPGCRAGRQACIWWSGLAPGPGVTDATAVAVASAAALTDVAAPPAAQSDVAERTAAERTAAEQAEALIDETERTEDGAGVLSGAAARAEALPERAGVRSDRPARAEVQSGEPVPLAEPAAPDGHAEALPGGQAPAGAVPPTPPTSRAAAAPVRARTPDPAGHCRHSPGPDQPGR